MLKVISTTVHKDVHKEFKSLCAYNDVNMSQVVSELIRIYLHDNYSKKSGKR